MTRIAAIVLILLIAPPCLQAMVSASGIGEFGDGKDEIACTMTGPDYSSWVNVILPARSFVLNATMNIEGLPSETNGSVYPASPSVLLDNTTLWSFSGGGFGAFGKQSGFLAGPETSFGFGDHGGSRTATVRLPKNATVTNATMSVDCSGHDDFTSTVTLGGDPLNLVEQIGGTVADAGDVNGDGYNDLIAGCGALTFNSFRGPPWSMAYLFYGGPDMDGTNDIGFTRDDTDTSLWYASGAGDVNGDGYDDVIIGSPFYPNGGRAYIYLGGPAINDTPAILANPGKSSGWAVACAGDLNSDGYDDVVVGTRDYPNGGEVSVYLGGPVMNGTPDITLTGDGIAGTAVANAGDVNGDGIDDIIVGAESASRAYIYYGGKQMNATPDRTLEEPASEFGYGVAGAGDVNRDGYDDVVVTGCQYVADDQVRVAQIFYGGRYMDDDPDITLKGPVGYYWNDNFDRCSVSRAGDLNGDGFGDFIVGCPSDSSYAAMSLACIYLGGPSMNGTPDIVLFNPLGVSGNFGASVCGISGMNDDELPLAVVGAPTNEFEHDIYGRAFIYSFKNFGLENASVGIGGEPVWACNGSFSGAAAVPDFAKALNGYLRTAAISGSDDFGNLFVDVPFNASAGSRGTIRLGGLNITYDHDAAVPDFSAVLNDYLTLHAEETDQNGSILVVFEANAETEGRLKLSSLDIELDEPPILLTGITDIEIREDSAGSTLLDLQEYFKDDLDPVQDLTYSVVSVSDPDVLDATIVSDRYLSVKVNDPGAASIVTGTVKVTVSVADSRGQAREPFVFTVVIMHDLESPIISSAPILLGVVGDLYSYGVVASDADNDPLSFGLMAGPKEMTMDRSSGWIRWIPPKIGDYPVSLSVSNDHVTVYQNFSIHVVKATPGDVAQPNRSPAFSGSPAMTAFVGKGYASCARASDPDGDPLVYSLIYGPAGMVIDPAGGTINWTAGESSRGNVSVRIRVQDGRGGSAELDFAIHVFGGPAPVVREPPVEVGGPNYPVFAVILAFVAAGIALLWRRGKANRYFEW